jgi:hypothetical protein
MTTINFTPQKLADLKVAYEKAKAAGKESFVFEGNELLVSYAKYLIEYLEGQFK